MTEVPLVAAAIIFGAFVAILAFLWSVSRDVRQLHRCVERDLRKLSERVAAVEGQVSTMLGMLRGRNGEDAAPGGDYSRVEEGGAALPPKASTMGASSG